MHGSTTRSTSGGMRSLNAMMATPAARSAAVWPMPQNVPRRQERTRLRSRLTNVDMAAM
ncbi:MAG TPA: hypothetical protein VE932_09770 [Patescibacteria group bacterium]|nr:hypothetical protein [Patescibacteria group bacterium]